MYKRYYGFKEKPFNVSPDPDFLYLGKYHKEALANLIYGISERKGFIVITGEVGTGKTTLIHTLLERLDKTVKTALIFNPNLSLQDFFLTVLNEFDLKAKKPTKAHFLFELNNFLIESLRRNENPVLIIDEAQNLTPLILEEIRLLLNLETSKDKLLQIVLAGQPELDRKLNLPELRQLKQRISVRYHIPPLDRKEVEEYITQRLRIAGCQDCCIFTKKAIDKIFNYSKGIPRLINIVCDNSFLFGYASDQPKINHKIVRECIGDLELKGKNAQEPIGVVPTRSKNPSKSRAWRMTFALMFLLFVLAGEPWLKPEIYQETQHSEQSPNLFPYQPVEKVVVNTFPDIADKVIQPKSCFQLQKISQPKGKSPPEIITVKKDDWLSKIVSTRYGKVNPRILSLVKEANPQIDDGNYIEVGWKILLPELNDTELTHDPYSNQ